MRAADIEIERDTEMRITFDDGVTAVYPLGALRAACPCAGCRGQREQGNDIAIDGSISVVDAELTGAWGVSIRWSDGHDTGIYAWTHLRKWWDAGQVLPYPER